MVLVFCLTFLYVIYDYLRIGKNNKSACLTLGMIYGITNKSMSSKDDIYEYLKRLKNGERCLDEFFYAVSGFMRYIAYKYLVDKSFAHDVVTNAFYKVIDNIGKFDDSHNGMAWICKITQNEAYAINNRERRYAYVSLDDVKEEVACTVDETENLEFSAALDKALSKLPEQDRKMVEMRVVFSMTYQEIATTFGMHVSTAYKRVQSALKIVRKDLSR